MQPIFKAIKKDRFGSSQLGLALNQGVAATERFFTGVLASDEIVIDLALKVGSPVPINRAAFPDPKILGEFRYGSVFWVAPQQPREKWIYTTIPM